MCLTGCNIYVAPTSRPQAKLGILDERFVNQTFVGIMADQLNCKNEMNLYPNYSQAFNGKPIPIEANKPITLFLSQYVMGYLPSIFIVTFYPNANNTYLISMHPNGNILTFQLVKMQDANGKVSYQPITFIKRKFNNSVFSLQCTDQSTMKKLFDKYKTNVSS